MELLFYEEGTTAAIHLSIWMPERIINPSGQAQNRQLFGKHVMFMHHHLMAVTMQVSLCDPSKVPITLVCISEGPVW